MSLGKRALLPDDSVSLFGQVYMIGVIAVSGYVIVPHGRQGQCHKRNMLFYKNGRHGVSLLLYFNVVYSDFGCKDRLCFSYCNGSFSIIKTLCFSDFVAICQMRIWHFKWHGTHGETAPSVSS